MPRPAFPTSLRQFQRQFADEEACRQYLEACRWPDGFRCPHCGHERAFLLRESRRRECAACQYQVSLTAGTVFHRTKTPLTLWFWATYLMTTDKRGISAWLLQRQLAIRRYETAWLILHKLRRAMVNTAREPLHGEVELDDTWVGGPQPGLRGSRQLKGRKAALVAVAAEKRDTRTGRVRMEVIPDFGKATLTDVATRHIASGATIYTDGLKQFSGLVPAGYRPVECKARQGPGGRPVLPCVHRAIGNLQQWLIGTYHGVGRHQLQVYLDEFVFRHNRRQTPMAAFQTLLGLGTGHGPTTRRVIQGAHDLPQFPIRS